MAAPAPPGAALPETAIDTTLVYVLRTFPELSETFILREMRALAAAGVPVRVLALGPGRGAEMVAAAGDPLPPVRYLAAGGRRLPLPPAPEVPRPLHPSALRRAVTGDLRRLRWRPRPAARALRLALHARRAARLLPGGEIRLHAHFANDAAALARYTAVLAGVPYRLTAHAYDIYQDPFLLAPNMAAAEAVYTVSAANVEHLGPILAEEGGDPARVRLLRCGMDLAAFPYREPPPPAEPARLLCIARLVPKKGHALLLQAVAALARRSWRLELGLVGDGPLRADLVGQVRTLGLDGRVTFHGPQPADATQELLRDADLLVLASRVAADGDRDGLPVALVEAMAAGVPVVATKVSGIPELVDETTGWLAPPDDPAGLAEAIADALEEPLPARRERARRARSRVESAFDLARQVEALSGPV